MTVDHEGFENEMEKQRERARAARQDVDSMQVQGGVLGEIKVASEFVGYGTVATESNVVALVKNGEYTDSLQAGEEGQLILDVTPFYAESGGQIADRGYLLADGVKVLVKDVQKAPNGQNLHKVVVEEGTLTKDAAVKAIIDTKNRSSVVKNHTATHLLHQALKDVLGTHVNQAGSLVTSERLRFDFSHFGQVQADELEKIERMVNEKIWESIDVEISQKQLKKRKKWAQWHYSVKNTVMSSRVVQVGDYSLELCGGCHVDNTASIGIFKIVAESGIGAGTRRIEAVTGKSAYELMNDQVGLLKEAAGKMKTNPKDILTRVDGLFAEVKQLQKKMNLLLRN